jgi:hypothetical protein
MPLSFKKSSLFFFLAFCAIAVFGQSFPKYAANVGGRESGQITKGAFLAQQGVGGTRFIADHHWESIPIDSFSIVVLRDTLTILHRRIKGQLFSDDLKTTLKALTTNDKILIYNIYGRDYGDKVVYMRPLELTIE